MQRAWLGELELSGPRARDLPWVLRGYQLAGFSGLEAAGRWRQLRGNAGECLGPHVGQGGGRWGGAAQQ